VRKPNHLARQPAMRPCITRPLPRITLVLRGDEIFAVGVEV